MLIEQIIKTYLEKNISVPIFHEIPSNPPGEFVCIQKTGNSRENYINSAVFAFQSYGTSQYNACELNEKIKEVVLNITSENDISGVSLNADAEFNDITRKKHRYQSVFVIDYYTNY